ncbi:MAG TPA: DUF3263 domain-containing protein [Actinomycetota bacterium]|nr:DUF3263 domain-containing protein [Actinomycetota bacterium]
MERRLLDILEFEGTWWRDDGTKADAISGRLGMSAARYYRLLDRVIDMPEALRHDPLLVKRLRRRRTERRRQRLAAVYGLRI